VKNLSLRPARQDDARVCGDICFRAFSTLAQRHGFPSDVTSAQSAIEFMPELIEHPGIYAVVAEQDGRVVGSNFLDERNLIRGIGPITVDPDIQARSVGRLLMEHVLSRAQEQHAVGVRLCQVAFNNSSLSLYSKLGFQFREPLSAMQGTPPDVTVPGHKVRAATMEDFGSCNDLCHRVHGHDRSGELRDAVTDGTARVAESHNGVTGYATNLSYDGHVIGRANDDLQALICSADAFGGTGILIPTRNTELFRWCLDHDLQIIQQMSLMTTGLYNEPQGAWMPSVLY
jgi:predicted N-acetyltransferase YhbS